MLNEAIKLAVDAHAGQVDKAGEPYILHPLRVMQAVFSETDRVVAVLHDVVEDSSTVGLGDILALFGEEVRAAVDALTRRDGEDYFDYVRRAKANPIARRVKWADLCDNLRPADDDCTDAGDRRRRKYQKARDMLNTIPALEENRF